ncbi:hypothetical protein Leryth_000391 [Lithospermum erythrorhizon]|nr:hypothetical protein Leryth_000391 [Lithospermum erythrorhizon]
MTAPEQSSALRQKWVNLNSASQDGFGIPIQVIPLSKLTPSKRKSLVLQLRSELEQIRLIQKKVETHRANAASMMTSGGNIPSYVNTGKDPPGGIINKSFPLTSGPGKKSAPSGQKARGWNPGVTGRFKSANKTPVTDQTTATYFRQCDNLLKKLMTHQFGWVFNKPVDVVELKIPDYLDVIKHPMDFGTIKRKIDSDDYSSPLEFAADVRLTFSNAMTYNPPGNDVHIMADTMSKFFETRWKPIQKKIDATSYPDSTVQRSVLHDEIEIVDPMAPCKKRKPSPLEEVQQRRASPEQSEVVTDQIQPKMTDEEKRILSKDLESSVDDLPENIIDFLKKQCSKGGEVGEEEIEIDIDALGDDALFTLRRLLDELLQGKLANTAKAETCEMELPNESGLSNSSMQLGKESLNAVEGVDIGENAPAGSSYPTVEIEKDSTLISNQLCNAESMDDTDSSSSSDSESECPKEDIPTVPAKDGFVDDDDHSKGNYNEKANGETAVDENKLVNGEDLLEQNDPLKSNSEIFESQKGGDGSPTERQVSPEKLYRAAILKNRFADIILKVAQEKPLGQGDKVDPEKQRRERGELEMIKRKEKARLQAEAKAAEDARKRVEAEAAAEVKRVRELEREAARQALLKMEKTVEINENSRFLEDLEMLSGSLPLEHLPSSIEEETSPDDSQDGLGSFKFGGSNPLEQLGLYMKVDDDEEEPDATTNGPNMNIDDDEEEPNATNGPDVVKDVEEGEID